MDAVSDEKTYRRTWLAWALYDVGNSAFYLVIVGTLFPFFYQELHVQALLPDAPAMRAAVDALPAPGHGPAAAVLDAVLNSFRTRGGSALATTAAAAMVVVAVLGPILGTLSDRSRAKKKFLAGFACLGVVSSGLMAFIADGDWALASTLYAAGTVGVAGSLVFYDALLPGIARPGDVDRISTIGFAAGYGGSVLLLVLNAWWVLSPGTFGLPDAGAAARLSFASVAVWWALFTIPLLKRVPEPPAGGVTGGNPVLDAFRQLGRTFRKVTRYRQLLLFLFAFWIYFDGVGTIIKLAVAFGNNLGIGHGHLILALILTQIVGVPCALAFGKLAGKIGPKASILIGLGVYGGICVFASTMDAAWQFYVLAGAVGTVQGGVQALSRSLFASMIPRTQAAEFFGFFSTMAKFAGIFGPLLLGLLWSDGGDPRRGILWLSLFFVVGGGLLLAVNVPEGRRVAEAEGKAA